MKSEKDTERRVVFQGAHLKNIQANRVGFAAILGFLGYVFIEVCIGTPNTYVSFSTAVLFAGIGYLVAKRIFAKRAK